MKRFIFALLHATRVTSFCTWWYRKRVIFLCYHGVTNSPTRSPTDPKGLHVNARRFSEHLDFLQRHYQVVSLRQYLTAQRNGSSLPYYSCVLTFDDGFRNFLTVAAPLLAERNMAASVFLITDKAGETSGDDLSLTWEPQDDQRYLTWDDARALRLKQNIHFGSHTCSHSGLLTLSFTETERELLHSYNEFHQNLPGEIAALSYPKGQYSRILADQARNVGYECAVTTDRGPNELGHEPFTLGRTLIGDDDDKASFAVRVSGLRWWLVRALAPGRSNSQPSTAPGRYAQPEILDLLR